MDGPGDPPSPLSRARVRLRLVFEGGARIGPGKADLLEAIAETGSISAAGRRMGMSYRRAWLLVSEMDRLFARPVVETSAGGAGGGGARLTPLGHEVVAAYRRLEARAAEAAQAEFAALAAEMRDPPPAAAADGAAAG